MTKMTDIDLSILSDLHKDAYGYRPSKAWIDNFEAMTLDEQNVEWGRLCKMVEEQIESALADLDRDSILWEGRIRKLAADLHVDIPTAIRWDMDAYNIRGNTFVNIDHYCYENNISSNIFNAVWTEE